MTWGKRHSAPGRSLLCGFYECCIFQLNNCMFLIKKQPSLQLFAGVLAISFLVFVENDGSIAKVKLLKSLRK